MQPTEVCPSCGGDGEGGGHEDDLRRSLTPPRIPKPCSWCQGRGVVRSSDVPRPATGYVPPMTHGKPNRQPNRQREGKCRRCGDWYSEDDFRHDLCPDCFRREQ